MSCVFPGGIDSIEKLWTFLCQGGDAISEVPADRWNTKAVYDSDPHIPGKTTSRWGGFVHDIGAFDPAFFGISPREAAVMDPQQRMLLEAAWRAFEDAGLQVERLAGSHTGVYIGISYCDYNAIQRFERSGIDIHTSTGSALSIAANRLSHRFDFRGPSLSIDTACSSSLVALDAACAALRSGECDLAVVGGVNAILTPDVTITFSRASMLSPDGRCKSFAGSANGYVRSEGAGVVVLKPLVRARADGDRIRSVVRATAVNQDGRTTTITVPSLDAQIALLRDACKRGAIEPSRVRYVEAHGTGTPVGDPIEAQAIGTVFGRQGEPCLIGSIKSNIGHLEPAAGIAGLIKASLCVEKGAIPPNLHFEAPNPGIPFAELGIEVSAGLQPFPETMLPRVAAVNSFGFGGTNACAIVEEPPPAARARQPVPDQDWPVLLPLSAASGPRLAGVAKRLADALDGGVSLMDAAGTLALRQSHLDYRAVVPARTVSDAVANLRSFGRGEIVPGLVSGRRAADPRVAFVFTGQGAQWWGMGRGLLARDPVFRATVEDCDRIFARQAGWSLREEFAAPQERSRMDQTIVTQPATFALQVGLAARWKAWGIEPAAVIGHSIGEIAAAYVSGALSLQDAIAVVCHRSRLQERARLRGGMAALGLSAQAARTMLERRAPALEIAAVNAPELVTIAGPRSDIERLIGELRDEGNDVFCQLLHVDYAFHSRQMDPFEGELRVSLEGLAPERPNIPMFSTVTGAAIADYELTPDYWWRNVRKPVLFRTAIDAAIDAGFDTFVELGAHPILSGPIRDCLAHRGRDGMAIASLRREHEDLDVIATAVAELHVRGVDLEWTELVPGGWQFVDLPKHQFERANFWAESESSRHARLDGPPHPLLGQRLRTAAPTWQVHVGADNPRFLKDHCVGGSVVFPAAGYVELMLAAAREGIPDTPWELEAIRFHDALVLAPQTSVTIETSLDAARGRIDIVSRVRGGDPGWTLQASARARAWPAEAPHLDRWQPEIEPPARVDRLRFYRRLASDGHAFGPAFQGVQTLWREQRHVLGFIRLPAAAGSSADYLLHPAMLDSCFQTMLGFRDLDCETGQDRVLALPVAIDRLRFFRRPSDAIYARAEAVGRMPNEIVSNISIIDEAGQLVAVIEGMRCRLVPLTQEREGQVGSSRYREQWIEIGNLDRDAASMRARGQTWLILADRTGMALNVARRLAEQGGRPILVFGGAGMRRLGDDCFEARVGLEPLKQDLTSILATLDGRLDGVVQLWPLDCGDGPVSTAKIKSAQETGINAAVGLVQALADAGLTPRLFFVTAGAAAVPADNQPTQPAAILHAALTGAVRSIANELPDFRPTLIDLDPGTPEADALVDEVLFADVETEIALRSGTRYACRLARTSDDGIQPRRKFWDADGRTPVFRLTMTSPGLIDNLVLREADRPEPKSGEALIEVHAASLNFRDVMAATGLLPAEAEDGPAWQRLGLECAGVVRAVGDGVAGRLVGRRVIGVASGCFASHVCVPAALTFEIPDELSFEAAAAIPVAYATAHYALVTLGRIRPGDCVLVHAATGGVGLAALEIAHRHGAQVIATAGTPEKRAYLKAKGIDHVFDSRSLAFADGVMATTNGRGVDLVLNSLPGPFLEKGLSVLAPSGRFLEIGKRDIYADTPLGLHALRRNIAFFAIDIARLAVERPQLLRQEVKDVLDDLNNGRLARLPVQTFALAEAAAAFRCMTKAQHIGKIVVSYAGTAAVEGASGPERIFRADASYLVTGGLGGFGLAIARWFVACGARALILVGRSGAASGDAQTAVADLRAAGATVAIVAADVAQREGVAFALAEAERVGKPLRGIVHAAGVIDDAFAIDLDGDRVARVFDAKAIGAWHLHDLTRTIPLDFFVCLSSIAGLLGTPGQAHYAGANRTLDAIAAARRAEGLPSLSIAWGAIDEVGFLARRPDVARYLEQSGVKPIPVNDALRELGRLLDRDCACVAFAAIAWPQLSQANPALAACPRTAGLAVSQTAAAGSGGYLRTQLLALPEAKRLAMAASFLRDQISVVLKVPPDTIEIDRPLVALGLDSLTSFELKNRVERELGTTLPIGKFLRRPTARDLALAIVERLDAPLSGSERSVTDDVTEAEPPMSLGQEALWFAERLAPESPAYGLAMCVAVGPDGNPDHLAEAFPLVIARHECLRLSFPFDGSGPLPRFVDLAAFKMALIDATAWGETLLREELDRLANMPFDLANGPLVRLHVFKRRDDHVVLLHMHHIVSDATSFAIVVEELFEAYFALRDGLPLRWSRPTRPFSQYAEWEKRVTEGAQGAAHRAFWREQLAGAPAELNLPLDYPRPPGQRGPGAAHTFVLPDSLGRRIKQLAKDESTTSFVVLLAAFNVLLHRLGGDTDIVVGTPASVRTQPGFEDIVGYLVNPVAIRTRLEPARPIRDLVASVEATVRNALDHQEYPFARIVRDGDLALDPARSPLFQVMFAMERSASVDSHGFAVTLLNMEGAVLSLRDLTFRTMALQRDRAQFDLAFAVEEFEDKIYGVVDYRTDLWHASMIERLVEHYEMILRDIAAHPDRAVAELGAASRGAVLSGPRVENVTDVLKAIRLAAAAAPNGVAVEAADGRLTYRELMDRSGRFATGLAARGIGPQSLIAICLGRGCDLVPAMLGVLDAGAAYVPIDGSQPPARIEQILADTDPALIIGGKTAAENLSGSGYPVRSIDEISDGHSAHPPRPPGEGALAYLLHTSGSTGRPAGVEVTRSGLSNLIATMRQLVPLGPSDAVLAATTITFDASMLELLLPLASGARLVLADEVMRSDGRLLAARLAKGDITVMQGTPATWQLLIDAGWQGNATFTALCGGEALPRPLADALLDRAGVVWNEYGPTETTINATCARVTRSPDPVTIGRPLANTVCYVVDECLNRVPVGLPGELLIGGNGIARGYRNDPERTAARFIPDPFDPSGRAICFRTGDFVRMTGDGDLIYLGRRDHQVKVRGFRVELGEIEAVLASHLAVRSAAAVMLGSDVASRRIVAYVTVDPSAGVDVDGLNRHLRQRLPGYMLPATIGILDSLPQLPNGKIDRRTLANTPISAVLPEAAQAVPANPTEGRLLAIVRTVLGPDIGLDDDFFAVGGTSLLGMRYIIRASEVFGVDLGPGDLMLSPTVRRLVQRIAERHAVGHATTPAQEPQARIEDTTGLWRPLALARAEGAFERVDAAAIAYLPGDAMRLKEFRHLLSGPAEPHWMGTCRTTFGTIALIVAPLIERDLFNDPAGARSVLDGAVAYAARLGARCVSLTGLIPAVTNLGRDLTAPGAITLTTGHAATACAMALTIKSVAAAASRDLREEAMGFVGLGAIGTATLRLLLACVVHPRSLVLCDVPAKLGHLQCLAREAVDAFGFCGTVAIATTNGTLPNEVYGARFLVGATNAPNVIDVARVRPGTAIVDDSFPLCFDLDRAIQRLSTKGDIFFAAGGFVRPPGPIDWTLALPGDLMPFARDSRLQEMLPSSTAVTGCLLSSLLPNSRGLAPTLGEVTAPECREHWQAFTALGIDAAPLHCGAWKPTPADITRFRADVLEAV